MRTPTTPRGRAAYDHLPPLEAIVKAWTEPGPSPYWHRTAQDQVRRAMPVLARALDRAAGQRSPARAEAIIRRQERYIEELESVDAVGLKARAQRAEARIEAVEDVLDGEERSAASMDLGACGIGEGWSAAVSVADIRRALDGDQ